jgi:hypothetical protein
MRIPTFGEWLLARGALPVQAQINPFPTTKDRLRQMKAKPIKASQARFSPAGRLSGQPSLPALGGPLLPMGLGQEMP